MRRHLVAAAAALVALAAPAAASAASTLEVTANPLGGDTDLVSTVKLDRNAAGTPTGEVATIGQALTAEFVNQLDSFAVCPESKFDNVKGPTAENCADRTAIVGSGRIVTHQSGADTTSDQGVIVKTGGNKLVFWWHVTLPGGVEAFGQAPGAVSQETGLFGPVVTWDFTGLPAGVRVKELSLTLARNATSGKAPFAATTCAGGSWGFQARITYEGGTAAETAGTTVPCGPAAVPVAPQPSKLELARATIYEGAREIDVLAPITARASGNVDFELYAAGIRHRWTAPVDSDDGRIRFRQDIPASQASLGTGILTMTYKGDADTRPQTVRLRSANNKANLRAGRPTLVNGTLQASGTISGDARGVVRVQLEYYSGGKTTTLEKYATIVNGSWSLSSPLTPEQNAAIAARSGPVHSYILFTGYFPRRMRGEMESFQVLP